MCHAFRLLSGGEHGESRQLWKFSWSVVLLCVHQFASGPKEDLLQTAVGRPKKTMNQKKKGGRHEWLVKTEIDCTGEPFLSASHKNRAQSRITGMTVIYALERNTEINTGKRGSKRQALRSGKDTVDRRSRSGLQMQASAWHLPRNCARVGPNWAQNQNKPAANPTRIQAIQTWTRDDRTGSRTGERSDRGELSDR